MKIVVLDGYALNPGDLSWESLLALGEGGIHERTAPGEVVARAQDAEVVLTNKTPLTAESLAQLPKLRYIGVLATGYNVVDVAAARARGIVVTNVPAYGTRAVAQHTIALLLELSNHVGRHAAGVRTGEWSRRAEWCYWERPLIELDGLTLGVIGAGRIGQAVAHIAAALGMKTLLVGSREGAAERQRVLSASDVISLHCPLTPDTHGMINRESLARCRSSALLLNTARGALIHEADLAAALNEGRLAGAALDVLSTEPPAPDNPLLSAANCLVTPHIAWAARAARQRLMGIAVENLRAFLAGHPENQVS